MEATNLADEFVRCHRLLFLGMTDAHTTSRMRHVVGLALLLALTAPGATGAQPEGVPSSVRVERLSDGPIIRPHMDRAMGSNIAGPSLIRVPDWIPNPLGRYYLYFADHRGTYIRLAYADALTGPWTMHEPGSLHLQHSHFVTEPPESGRYVHIASPDVHVREDRREIVMYIHGQDTDGQVTRVSASTDGLRFEARQEILGRPYFRVFPHGGYYHALAMPGLMYRSVDGLTNFESGPRLFNDDMRHSAVLVRNGVLYVFWTQAKHAPERVLLSTIDLTDDWMTWRETTAIEVLRPEREWEGAQFPVEPSRRGSIDEPVNQLRDPAIYEEDGRVYLLYAVAGERGIGIAEIHFP